MIGLSVFAGDVVVGKRGTTYAKNSQADDTECLEDDDNGEIDLEAVDVVVVEVAVEPADEEVVEDCEEDYPGWLVAVFGVGSGCRNLQAEEMA